MHVTMMLARTDTRVVDHQRVIFHLKSAIKQDPCSDCRSTSPDLSSTATAMAAVDVGASHVPPVPSDDLDDIFDYGVNNDLFRDVDSNMTAPATETNAGAAGKDFVSGLGIDEEIKVAKKRAPIAKLDEARWACIQLKLALINTNNPRLLSPAGIPRLRRVAKEQLRFKGKGHEVS